jgi:hypothetical protein
VAWEMTDAAARIYCGARRCGGLAAGGERKAKRARLLARKLLIALWRLARDGVVPEGARMRPAA